MWRETTIPRESEQSLRRALQGLRSSSSPEESFEPVFKLIHGFVRGRVRRSAKIREDAELEDVTQDILLRVLKSREIVPTEPREFFPWLVVVVENYLRSRSTAATTLKRRGRRREVSLSDVGDSVRDAVNSGAWNSEPAVSSEVALIDKERAGRLYRAVATLPEQQRRVLGLRLRKGLSEAEVAETMGISIETVRAHRRRALGRLRELLRDDFEEIEI